MPTDSTTPPQLIAIFERTVDQYPQNLAIICNNISLTYAALDRQANQLAHYLQSCQVHAGDVIGVLLPRSIECYIAMLALYKIGAVYVPIAEEYPVERVNHILDDMTFNLVITAQDHLQRAGIHFPKTLILHNITDDLAKQPTLRLPSANTNTHNPTCYIIYTSGSTGKPNGVEVGHRSICHYVTVASTTYGITPTDRVYHGFSLAFDASFEEIWMAFANGATLVVATSKDIRSGLGLIEFLNQNQITVFSTVPTLLASLHGNVDTLRLLILGGEVCAPHILKPWMRTNLKIINTYGPTEATVVTTYAEYHPDRPLTIGRPLPGYEVLILNEHLEPVASGEAGELCVAGTGLAKGYINRAAITAKKFIANPQKSDTLLYRTGDLAHWNEHGDLVFLGRVDDQVKLRGFRMELNEIETILLTYPGIQQAVVALLNDEEPKLVAYYTAESIQIDIDALKKFLAQHLPAFMLPTIYEPLAQFPRLPSGKVDRKHLPIPKSKPQTNPYHAPKTPLEVAIARIMAPILKLSKVSITDDFFYDLGGHSLNAAAVISELRKHPACQHLSMLDLYQQRTIQNLAKFCAQTQTATPNAQKTPFQSTSSSHYRWAAGSQILGVLCGYALASWQIFGVMFAYFWTLTHYSLHLLPLLTLGCLLAVSIPICSLLLVIICKWLLLGRVKPGKYRLWGWFYLRWWLVGRLEMLLFPAHHFVGTPVMIWYYRWMGAKIGSHCHIHTPHMSVHDLIQIGDHTSINHDAVLKAYFIEDGYLHLGPITIGSDCYIGTRAVLSIHSTLADRASLDDLSLLTNHASIPSQQFFSGSPAQTIPCPPVHITQHVKERSTRNSLRRILMGILQCLAIPFVVLMHYGLYFPPLYWLTTLYQHHGPLYALLALPIAALEYFILLSASTITLKYLLRPLQPGYFSIHSVVWLKHWIISRLLDLPESLAMADSMYYPIFLRLLGAKLGADVEMSEISHLTPELISVHEEGFVAAYASIGATQMYHDHICLQPTTIGKESFVGNRGVLPQGTHLQDGSLLACLSVLSPHAEQTHMKHATWLGSPAILLPNRENANVNIALEYQKPSRWLILSRLGIELVRILIPSALNVLHFFLLYIVWMCGLNLAKLLLVFPIAELSIMLSIVGAFIVLKWILIGRYRPEVFPLWHPFIRRKDIVEYTYGYFLHQHVIQLIMGSPLITWLLRALGTQIGRYTYIETGSFEEFDLIHIEDEVAINSNAIIQTHLYEDRIFKMSHIHIQSRCNIGRDSIVLYDTQMEPDSKLGSLSLLMKGETLPAHSMWEGCPAQVVD